MMKKAVHLFMSLLFSAIASAQQPLRIWKGEPKSSRLARLFLPVLPGPMKRPMAEHIP